MDVERKRKLAAMAAALEIAAEDDDYDDQCGFLRRKRSVWVKPWLTRKSLGMQNQLYQELLASDPEEYKRLLRLSCEQFDQLLALIQPSIGRQDTVMRSSVPAKTRLQVTLRFLASGDGGVWQTTPLQQAIEKKKAGIPTSVQVGAPPGMSMPAVLVGDDAFPLSENLMKPYAGHPQPLNRCIFNYSVYAGEQSNQVPQDTFFPVQPVRGSRLKVAASTLRDRLCDYFNGDGSVPWQADKAFADVSKYQQAATH
ncbi:hypothetical protein HPB50_013919 [Hyalomma asiaticum]|uniref:Uncharacterized protein n=1 Tax=Hyalomma asiaticum TaxID=266040 RepID=A0ACB7SEY7_HYAAI|nr:hypothetical protein HPB50_013919 [Hyalomma asiaticum]